MFLFPLYLVTVLAWDRHKHVSIPALSSDAPPSNHLYPVRMLTIYVDRTRNAHPVKILERLFVLKRVPLTFLVRLYHFGLIYPAIRPVCESTKEELLTRHSVKSREVHVPNLFINC
jgi:hypothetical protein